MEKQLRVLVCDDSLLIRKKFRQTLEKCNCKEIYEAENGVEAVEAAKKYKPNLIFLDIVMPEKDGIEALKEIKEFAPEIKVVMATSVGTSKHLKESVKNGAYDFIQKPITLENVLSIIEKVLKEDNINV